MMDDGVAESRSLMKTMPMCCGKSWMACQGSAKGHDGGIVFYAGWQHGRRRPSSRLHVRMGPEREPIDLGSSPAPR